VAVINKKTKRVQQLSIVWCQLSIVEP